MAKRWFDIASALFFLVLLAPMIAAVAAVVKCSSKGPVFFRHKRLGLNGEEFYLLKFRTMVQDADARKMDFTPEQLREYVMCYKVKDDPRITPVGRVLRNTSIDELPQLINVLAGEMSLIGPRPVTKEELLKYGNSAEIFLSVRPGITGLWQVSGRSDLSYEDRVNLDVKYVMQCGPLQDMKILLRTFGVVLYRMGAY